ncbi:Reticulon-domain-containing protein [Triangularia verruculosa]|uniref:Reticulon-like protein n=1 Tax=Triangularia verruculosa TaxID=2587418 RepID=A0AAN6XB09_9PEZI|nr:Reticulon-domain-containing protein [Triangularia verruculosa]
MADYANGHANGNPNVDALKNNIAATYNNVTNGPVAQNIKAEGVRTTDELSNLANSRRPPSYTAATGQPLTHYHSFFSELLSWKNPRASGIAYLTIISLIFSVRYLDVLRWGFKLTWMALGVTIAAEVAGKAILNNGFATQLRPRKYYTVPRETLDAVIGDVNELINFGVIEAQRILFAENVWASAAVALGAFISYYLVKVVPYWGLALIATSIVFFAPLVYTTNQELIDSQLRHAGEIINDQTEQIRSLVQKNTEQATQVTKQYMGDYTAKAQSLIKGAVGQEDGHKSELKPTDFPSAPKEDFKSSEPVVSKDIKSEPIVPPTKAGEEEPLIAA